MRVSFERAEEGHDDCEHQGFPHDASDDTVFAHKQFQRSGQDQSALQREDEHADDQDVSSDLTNIFLP